jgi:predicted ATP-grasp superfamily ATP-dependent carboligase
MNDQKKSPQNSLNVLIVGWGTTDAYFHFESLKSLDNNVNFYLATSNDIPIKIAELFNKNKIVYTDTYDKERLVRDVVHFVKKIKVNFEYITTFFEMNVIQTAYLAEHFGIDKRLKYQNAIHTSANKSLMRGTLQKTSIQQPLFFHFSEKTVHLAFEWYAQHKKPVVIKPTQSGHSIGARYIPKNRDFFFFEKMFNEAKTDQGYYYKEFLIEEYIEGKVFSIDGVIEKSNNIKIIGNSELEGVTLPHLTQNGHTVPIASLKKKKIDECVRFAKKVIVALNIEYSGFHCELKISGNKIYLIEIAGRLPGPSLLKSHQNVSITDIYQTTFEHILGCKLASSWQRTGFISETTISYFCKFNNYFTYKLPKTTSLKLHMAEIEIKSRATGEIVSAQEDIRNKWLFTIIARSKVLNANEILKLREKVLTFCLGKTRIKVIKDKRMTNTPLATVSFINQSLAGRLMLMIKNHI